MARVLRYFVTGSGVGIPSGVQWQSPWWGSVGQSPLEAESFLSIRTNEGPKDKDLNETI